MKYDLETAQGRVDELNDISNELKERCEGEADHDLVRYLKNIAERIQEVVIQLP